MERLTERRSETMTPSELAEALATAEQTVQNAKYGMEAMDSRPAVLARALLAVSVRLRAAETRLTGHEAIVAAARGLDPADYSIAHNRGCGQSSKAACAACRMDEAVAASFHEAKLP